MTKYSHTQSRAASINEDRTFWRNHPATSAQQHLLPFDGTRSQRQGKATQADVLIQLLRDARAHRSPLGLPSIMKAGIAQHGARMKELRDRGFVIQNHMERVDGVVHSEYQLVFDPENDAAEFEL
jgi:hypothetical protein